MLGGILFLAIVAASWVCIVAELSLIAKNLLNINFTLNLIRAEMWQRHQQIRGSSAPFYGSLGGISVKGSTL